MHVNINTLAFLTLSAVVCLDQPVLHKQAQTAGHVNTYPDSEKTDTNTEYKSFMPKMEAKGIYTDAKRRLTLQRDSLSAIFKAASAGPGKKHMLKEAGKILTQGIIFDLIPFWYGTPWTFEGHTSEPGKGTVACGYFVSTVLRDAGLNLNRYKLAQGSPAAEAFTISGADSISLLEGVSVKRIGDYFAQKDPGLYFIGLDYHVGFLLNTRRSQYFIHSNYILNSGVMIEPILDSRAFSSSRYYIVDITTNDELIRKWLYKERIEVVAE